MYFPNEEIKVNKFRLVHVPRNSDYMSRLGSVTPRPESFSGDAEVHSQQRKVEDLEYYIRYADQMAKEQQ